MITETESKDRPSAPSRASGLASALRPFLVPLAITALVVAGALVGPAALSDPASGVAPEGARLDVGPGYVLLAPALNVLDTLSLLTIGQHYAVLATLIAAFAAWRVLRRRDRRGWLRRTGIEAGVAAASLAGLLAFYGFGMVGHRPMAALDVTDPDVLVLDIHSHTGHSHDGRKSFDAEANREWHASAGFDAAYVSDHRTWEGFDDAQAGNPQRAGDWTTLLPALEIKFAGKYANALGAEGRYRHAADGNHLIADSLYRSLRAGGPAPTLILTIPGGIDGVPGQTGDSIGYLAVEVNDAAPRGLKESRRDREAILRLADSLDLALVAGSNNHGWGRTAAAWTLMRIPGWRWMSPAQLNAAIERTLHQERRDATRVVERRMPYTGETVAALWPTVPAIAWQMFGGMGPAERVSWLLWSWMLGAGLALLAAARRERERREAEEAFEPVEVGADADVVDIRGRAASSPGTNGGRAREPVESRI